MSEEPIREYARQRGFHSYTVQRWLGWRQADRDALFTLAVGLKLGENHLRDLMDWLEEIALRDGLGAGEILRSETIMKIEADRRLGRTDKLKRIKDQIRRQRFPRLSEIEDQIQARIRELKLHPEIKLSVPLGLEGAKLKVEFTVSSHEELKRFIAKLAEAVGHKSMGEIFGLLNGETPRSE